ncbi:Serpin_1 [Hexamita inflata]|uniref:Serpin_1 n=1 Tax=Hexamita inflata TaxID=28002 RepID=A0ABP1GWN9_9EUKA
MPFNGFTKRSEVNMMNAKFEMDYVKTRTAQVVRLPYSNSTLSACIILPLSKSQKDFKDALSLINLQPSFCKCETALSLPRFTISSSFNLEDLLQQFGVSNIFNNIDCAHTLNKQLRMQRIIQKTFIETNENGTEAEAVTAMLSSCSPEKVVCDRPFWFVLSGTRGVVFVSSVVE